MRNFFYDELNSLANINANTDEADDQVILSNFETPANIIGNIEEDQNFIYGKLNKEVEKAEYKGLKTRTANVIIDNGNMTISVDIDYKGLDSGFATDEQLQTAVDILNNKIDNDIKTSIDEVNEKLDSNILNLNNLLNEEINNRQQNDIIIHNNITSLDNKLNKEIVDRQNAIIDLKTTIDNEVKTNLDELRTEINENIKVDIDELRTEINDNIKVEIEDIKEDLAEEAANRQQQIEELENTINNEIKNSLDIMQEKLDDEVENRTEAIRDLENTINNNILTKLDTTVLQDTSITYDKDNVSLVNSYINLSSEVETSKSSALTLANDNQAGLMAIADYRSLRNLEARVGNLEGKTTRLLYTAKKKPTAEDIQAFIDAIVNESEEPEYSHPYEGLSIVVDETYHIWHYYENDNIGWKDDGVDTVHVFTNETSGIIKGSAIDGKIYAETDGTGSVFGWSELKTRVSNNESNIESNYNTLYAQLPRVYRLAEV